MGFCSSALDKPMIHKKEGSVKMFNLSEDGILYVYLPERDSQRNLVVNGHLEIQELIKSGRLYGLNLRINGRITTGMALMLGHELCHICKSISIFDPKENAYVLCIIH